MISSRFLSCNGLGSSVPQMVSAWLHADSKIPDWFQCFDRRIILTYQARYAIALLCRLLHISSGDEVLLPAYNCGAEVDPFIWAGAKVNLYRIDGQARIDQEDIIRRVTPATRLIYVTHFFGWPQEMGDLDAWCKKNGLCLVEDCALSLFSGGPSARIGRIGDAAIYSFPKSLAVPDGGALVLNKKICQGNNNNLCSPRRSAVIHNSLPLLKKWFMHENKIWQRFELPRKLLLKNWLKKNADQRGGIGRGIELSHHFDERKVAWSISRLSKGLITMINPKEIVQKRRRNYQYLQEALQYIRGFQPLFKGLPDEVCPLSFPALVKDRQRWDEALSMKGILVTGWPSYHHEFAWEEFPETCNLKDSLVALPIHQNLEKYHMEYIGECVKSIAESGLYAVRGFRNTQMTNELERSLIIK